MTGQPEAPQRRTSPTPARTEREMGVSDSSSGGAGLGEQRNRIALLREQGGNLGGLRLRASDDLMELRGEFKKRETAFNHLAQQHEELKAYFALASEQLEELAQRPVIEWLKPSDSEARMRIVAAERTVYEFLIGFADEVASIADKPKALLMVTELRARFAAVLEQLEAANDELAIVSEQLARREGPGRRLLRKLYYSKISGRLRTLIGARLRSVRTRNAAP